MCEYLRIYNIHFICASYKIRRPRTFKFYIVVKSTDIQTFSALTINLIQALTESACYSDMVDDDFVLSMLFWISTGTFLLY